MRLKRRTREGMEVSTEALNDIMFFLLLFFLILSTLVHPSMVKVNLPGSSEKSPIVQPLATISVTADLQYFVDGQSVTMEELAGVLSAKVSGQENPVVSVEMDRSVQIEKLVELYDLANQLKFNLILLTQPKQ